MTIEKVDFEKYFQNKRINRCALFEGDIGDEKHETMMKSEEVAARHKRLEKIANEQIALTERFLDSEFKKVLDRKKQKELIRKSHKEHPGVQHIKYVLEKHEEKLKKRREKEKKVKKSSIPKETLEEYYNLFNKKLLPKRESYGLGFKESEFGENYLYDNFKYGSSAYEKMIFDRDEKLGLNRSKLLACQKVRDYDAEKLLNMKVDDVESFEVFNKKAKELIEGEFIFKNVHRIPESDFPDEFLFYLRMMEGKV